MGYLPVREHKMAQMLKNEYLKPNKVHIKEPLSSPPKKINEYGQHSLYLIYGQQMNVSYIFLMCLYVHKQWYQVQKSWLDTV